MIGFDPLPNARASRRSPEPDAGRRLPELAAAITDTSSAHGPLAASSADALRVGDAPSRWPSAPPIVHVNDATETLRADELERNANVLRQKRSAAADDGRVDERVKLVDEVRCDHRGSEVRATDGEIAFARRLELANPLGLERAFDPRARGRRLRELRREHDLVRGSPHVGELALEVAVSRREWRASGLEMCGVPDGHRLVQTPAIEVCADAALELVDRLEELSPGNPPAEVALAIGDVAIEEC